MIDDWFGDDPESGALAASFVARLDAVLKRELPGILAAETAEAGAAVCVTMRDALVSEFDEAGDPRSPLYDRVGQEGRTGAGPQEL